MYKEVWYHPMITVGDAWVVTHFTQVDEERVRMRCPKCVGLMVLQTFFDHFINFEGWKCLNCGKIIEKREGTISDDAFSIFYQRQKVKRHSNE